ncbi:hypothetical protein AB0F81_28950 [Actinoplanes sp. NPDC024001]|uniref:hypothetical protein n=1 Tax=Actinoplanes sp. NPDC024001 TaxID=3154598 RepID=UPI0033CB9040
MVDVNHVPAEWLRNELDLTSEQVAELIQVREERRGLHGLDDILTYCKTLSPQRLMLIEDRLVYLPW